MRHTIGLAASEEEPPKGPAEIVSDDPVDAAWAQVVSKWDDPSAHKGFVVLASSLDRLHDAASRYKEAKKDSGETVVCGYRVPGDLESRTAVAEKGLQLVLAQAIVRLESAPRSSKRDRGTWLIPLSVLMFLFTTTFTVAKATGRRELASLPVLALEMLLVAVIPWRKLKKR